FRVPRRSTGLPKRTGPGECERQAVGEAIQFAHRRPSCGTAAASASRPRAAARSIAALRLVTPNLRYTAIACVLTVLRETKSRSPISRNERCVASSGRGGLSARLRLDGTAAHG